MAENKSVFTKEELEQLKQFEETVIKVCELLRMVGKQELSDSLAFKSGCLMGFCRKLANLRIDQ